jgi:alpha-beta hydrolase superfamily lysophospholipase
VRTQAADKMSVITEQSRATDEYEAVTVPMRSADSAVFVRRSTRPSRRAVLHLHELADSLAPTDLVRWYNERGFHFYLTDVGVSESGQPSRRRSGRSQPDALGALDAAYRHLREQDGIDAIILSAHGRAALTAAHWCDARPVSHPVEALILSNPDFGRERLRLDITCPVLVISAGGPWDGARRPRRGAESVSLGQHVTWLQIDAPAVVAPVEKSPAGIGIAPQRRRLFEEMGRWLGAYMYGQLRDQLL